MKAPEHPIYTKLRKLKILIGLILNNIKCAIGGDTTSYWIDLEHHSPGWDERTKLLSEYIPPNSRVIEFGAGRKVLMRLLPAGCQYTPSDIVDRGNNTLVLDLNAGNLPQIDRYDIAVFGGVLEYIRDVPSALAWISGFVDAIVFSYVATDFVPSRAFRRGKSWVNDYSMDEIPSLLNAAGFYEVGRKEMSNQAVFHFKRKSL